MPRPALRLVTNETTRPVLTTYYEDLKAKKVVRRNRSSAPLRAMELCLRHMRRNNYDARLAEVYDETTGKLYGVMKRTADGQVHPVFEEPLKKGE
jgi:hypothetical protein